MPLRLLLALVVSLALAGCAVSSPVPSKSASDFDATRKDTAPLSIGETFTLDSHVMGETRRINVFIPTIYGEKIDAPLPVLYMPDGGLAEDFLHIAGLVQVLTCNGGMRPFMLVGIENTQRRRDMTGPTTSDEDRKIAPVVGGSAAFRRFIRDELFPVIRTRYRTTNETAIIGESLAGLFVVETFFLEPDLFTSYMAIDPSLWWSSAALVKEAPRRLAKPTDSPRSLFVATSHEPDMARLTTALAQAFSEHPSERLTFRYVPLPQEEHATIYHPAALLALRSTLAPPPAPKKE